MKKSFSLLNTVVLLLVFCSGLSAQERYKDEITDSVRVETFTYAFKDGKSLDMDVYFPAFDNQALRPLIFYVHGGGFSGGSRNDGGIPSFCKNWPVTDTWFPLFHTGCFVREQKQHSAAIVQRLIN